MLILSKLRGFVDGIIELIAQSKSSVLSLLLETLTVIASVINEAKFSDSFFNFLFSFFFFFSLIMISQQV